MPKLNVDDVILLIHSEIATAVSSAQQYGQTQKLQLERVRVRMGQQDEGESLSFNNMRYPQAEGGWLIDVLYEAKEYDGLNSQSVALSAWQASSSLKYLSQQPVINLDGVGEKRALALNAVGIVSIAQLAEIDLFSTHAIFKELPISVVRKLKTLAALSLSTPPITVPSVLDSYKIISLIENFDEISGELLVNVLAGEHIDQLLQWLEQLEFCFDDSFFSTLRLKQLSPS